MIDTDYRIKHAHEALLTLIVMERDTKAFNVLADMFDSSLNYEPPTTPQEELIEVLIIVLRNYTYKQLSKEANKPINQSFITLVADSLRNHFEDKVLTAMDKE